MSQSISVGGFQWRKQTLRFNEEFIKIYDADSDKGAKSVVKYLKELQDI